MSEVSTDLEQVSDVVVDAMRDAVVASSEVVAEAAASVEKAVAAEKPPIKKPAKSAAKMTAAKPVVAAAPAKRKYKPRAKRAVAPALKAAPKAQRKAAAPVRRKYNRKSLIAAPIAVAAPLTEGIQKMSYEVPNWFAGFTATPVASKMQTLFTGAGEKSQDVVRKSQAMAEQMTEATRANVEAVVEAGRIAAAGARDLGQEVVASTRGGVEHASAGVKTLTEAKSPTEFFQLQSELVRSSFDRMVAESSKLTEHMVKLAGEAIQPLSNRASVSAEKFSELTS